MKLYRVDEYNPWEGNIVHWCSSLEEVAQIRELILNNPDNSFEDFHFHSVVIPTDKKGLLKWLNSNFNRDNG